MRARRKALQEARKAGLVNNGVPSKVALEQLHEGINPIDFSRLENEGGPGSSGNDEAHLQPAEVASEFV